MGGGPSGMSRLGIAVPTAARIHDPIHGSIEVSKDELRLIDSKPCQRLRYIRQLGFAEAAFPGATHSRYAHSLGAMQMATRMLDQLLPPLNLDPQQQRILRQATRLAVLFHDLGHPPLSHALERAMPRAATLGLRALAPYWRPAGAGDSDAQADTQANHEDYTLKLLLDSPLSPVLAELFAPQGVTNPLLVSLLTGDDCTGNDAVLQHEGLSLLPLLHQVVSSELDADRMDYLRRDAYYCGVSYGQFDHAWLINHLHAVPQAVAGGTSGIHADSKGDSNATSNTTSNTMYDAWVLALGHKAVWAFENFLLARYHMFLSVYYHHTSVCLEHLLAQFVSASGYALPSDTAAYLAYDVSPRQVASQQSLRTVLQAAA